MKKLMFAAAVAACATGAFADCTEAPVVEVPRVYQIQLNTYTTKGVTQSTGGIISGQQCGEDPEVVCLVMRGKDKTVIRGYVYICQGICSISDYDAAFADVRRGGISPKDETEFEWNILNAIGAHSTDAECQWNLAVNFDYGSDRSQKYELVGAGYGKVRDGATLFFDNLAGYFAGAAEGSYDFKTAKTAKTACACERSKVINCESLDAEDLFTDSDTVAFGAWKMKFNANVTKAIATTNPDVYILALLEKMFK